MQTQIGDRTQVCTNVFKFPIGDRTQMHSHADANRRSHSDALTCRRKSAIALSSTADALKFPSARVCTYMYLFSFVPQSIWPEFVLAIKYLNLTKNGSGRICRKAYRSEGRENEEADPQGGAGEVGGQEEEGDL